MKNFSTPFIEEAKEYVIEYIADHFTAKMCYHNIEHTLEVVSAVEHIGEKCGICEEELEILIIAALFHDIGYYLGDENHEETSSRIAKDFLLSKYVDVEFTNSVEKCILSTKLPQAPQTQLEQIICDADMYHLSTEHFFEKSELLLREFTYSDENMTREIWLFKSKEFIEGHHYHTKFGREVLFPQLKKNLDKLMRKIDTSNT